MSPLDKPKTIKKASEAVASSPIAGRTRATNSATTAPTLQEIMEGLQTFLAPQLAALKTDVVLSITTSVNDRFLDLENNLDQLKSNVDTQHQAMQDQLSHVLQRLEAVEKENAVLRGSPNNSPNQIPTSIASPQGTLGTGASKYVNIESTQEHDPVESPQHSYQAHESDDPLSGGRRSYTEIRKLLEERVKLKRGAVVDLHYPSASVIAILVHNDYAATAIKLLRAKKLEPIENFDPYHHSNLGDPKFKEVSDEERTARMKEVVDNQPYVTIEFLKKPEVKLSVARDFHRKGKITTQYLQELIQLHGHPNKSINTKDKAKDQDDDLEMFTQTDDEDMDHPSTNGDNVNSPNHLVDQPPNAVHSPSTGGGEPVPAL